MKDTFYGFKFNGPHSAQTQGHRETYNKKYIK